MCKYKIYLYILHIIITKLTLKKYFILVYKSTDNSIYLLKLK